MAPYTLPVAINIFHFNVSNLPLAPEVLLVCSVILFGIVDPSENLVKAMELLPRKMCKFSHTTPGHSWASKGDTPL